MSSEGYGSVNNTDDVEEGKTHQPKKNSRSLRTSFLDPFDSDGELASDVVDVSAIDGVRAELQEEEEEQGDDGEIKEDEERPSSVLRNSHPKAETAEAEKTVRISDKNSIIRRASSGGSFSSVGRGRRPSIYFSNNSIFVGSIMDDSILNRNLLFDEDEDEDDGDFDDHFDEFYEEFYDEINVKQSTISRSLFGSTDQLTPEEQKVLRRVERKRRRAQAREYVANKANMAKKSLTDNYTDFMDSAAALRLCLIFLIAYLVVGVAAFSFYFEHWSIVDSIYYAVVTFTTVGYGDLYPTTTGGKLFTIFFATFGIVIVGIGLGIIGARVMEAQEEAVKLAHSASQRRMVNVFSMRSIPGDELKKSIRNIDNNTPLLEQETTEEDIKRLEKEERQDIKMHEDMPSISSVVCSLLLHNIPVLVSIFVLAVWIGKEEEWDWVSSLYYCTVTITTIGYGDLSPSYEKTKILAIFLIPLSVAFLGELIGRVAGAVVDRQKSMVEHEFLSKTFTLADLIEMDTDGDGNVTEVEFLTFMLVAMNKVEEEDISELKAVFKRLDVSSNGVLDKTDLAQMERERLKRKVESRKRLLG